MQGCLYSILYGESGTMKSPLGVYSHFSTRSTGDHGEGIVRAAP